MAYDVQNTTHSHDESPLTEHAEAGYCYKCT